MPLNAACAQATFVPLYGLIFLGSSTAFASMVGACIVFMTTSYVISQGILAYRGREKILPARHLDLGWLGNPTNIGACVWVFFIDVVYCIPTAYPGDFEQHELDPVRAPCCMYPLANTML